MVGAQSSWKCAVSLIDDMPKVSLSSHMNGLRSPLFLQWASSYVTTTATLQGYPDLQPFLKKNELKAKQTASLLYHNSRRRTNGKPEVLQNYYGEQNK